MSVGAVRVEIEKLRKVMHTVATKRGISHPEVLKISQILDTKLNEYNKLLY